MIKINMIPAKQLEYLERYYVEEYSKGADLPPWEKVSDFVREMMVDTIRFEDWYAEQKIMENGSYLDKYFTQVIAISYEIPPTFDQLDTEAKKGLYQSIGFKKWEAKQKLDKVVDSVIDDIRHKVWRN